MLDAAILSLYTQLFTSLIPHAMSTTVIFARTSAGPSLELGGDESKEYNYYNI